MDVCAECKYTALGQAGSEGGKEYEEDKYKEKDKQDKEGEKGRKMATNMDEEQSLRECEAYVQMHG